MPSQSQESLLGAFNQAAWTPASGTNISGLIGGLSPAGDQGLQDALTQAANVINAQTQATTANTDALAQNTQGRGSSGGSTASSVTSTISTVSQFLGGGLSLMPLVSIFAGLFGGGGQSEPQPLVPYSMPPSLNLQSTTNYQSVAWGENGLPRAAGGATPTTPAAPASAAPQITVQVQAIDSQSFLDHSTEIAQAVRQAMLNMNSLNDVVTEL
jgi:hypothetical protein